MDGSGGLGAVSIGISEIVLIPVLLLLAFGAWKLAKLIWAALAG
jgi:Sec-independent protein translocase protein TatA